MHFINLLCNIVTENGRVLLLFSFPFKHAATSIYTLYTVKLFNEIVGEICT